MSSQESEDMVKTRDAERLALKASRSLEQEKHPEPMASYSRLLEPAIK